MKKTVHLLLFLFLFSFFNLSGQTYYYLDSLQILPSNPTTIDTVKVNVFGNFASTGSFITSCSIDTNIFQIVIVINCADSGVYTVLVPYDTTFTFRNLQAGNYIINLSGISLGDFVPPEEKMFTVIAATNIEDNSKINFVSVYPNPFSFETSLQTSKVFKNAILTVYNVRGKQVRQIKNISEQSIILHRDNLPSGLYFLRLTQENKELATVKLVILDE